MTRARSLTIICWNLLIIQDWVFHFNLTNKTIEQAKTADFCPNCMVNHTMGTMAVIKEWRVSNAGEDLPNMTRILTIILDQVLTWSLTTIPYKAWTLSLTMIPDEACI